MLPFKLWSILTLKVLATSRAFAWEHISEGEFDSVIGKNKFVLATFVGPLTEASKALEPEWNSASKESKEKLISIDCVTSAPLCDSLNIASYPAIRLFHDSISHRYRGPRKASAIISFLHRVAQPTVSYVDEHNITSFIDSDKVVFIAYLQAPTTNQSSSFYLERDYRTFAARYSDTFSFGITTSSPDSEKQGIPAGGIICHNQYSNTEPSILSVDSGPINFDTILNFINKASVPLIGEFTVKTEHIYLRSGKSYVYIFYNDEKDRDAMATALLDLASKFEEYLIFATVREADFGSMKMKLGLSTEKPGGLVVVVPMVGAYYPFRGSKIGEAEVEAFLEDIANGKVKSWSDDADDAASEEGVDGDAFSNEGSTSDIGIKSASNKSADKEAAHKESASREEIINEAVHEDNAENEAASNDDAVKEGTHESTSYEAPYESASNGAQKEVTQPKDEL